MRKSYLSLVILWLDCLGFAAVTFCLVAVLFGAADRPNPMSNPIVWYLVFFLLWIVLRLGEALLYAIRSQPEDER